jgi:hypothetical protein
MTGHEREIAGAVEMARYWIRNPGEIGSTSYPQLCRELYTISLALVRLAALAASAQEPCEP